MVQSAPYGQHAAGELGQRRFTGGFQHINYVGVAIRANCTSCSCVHSIQAHKCIQKIVHNWDTYVQSAWYDGDAHTMIEGFQCKLVLRNAFTICKKEACKQLDYAERSTTLLSVHSKRLPNACKRLE